MDIVYESRTLFITYLTSSNGNPANASKFLKTKLSFSDWMCSRIVDTKSQYFAKYDISLCKKILTELFCGMDIKVQTYLQCGSTPTPKCVFKSDVL